MFAWQHNAFPLKLALTHHKILNIYIFILTTSRVRLQHSSVVFRTKYKKSYNVSFGLEQLLTVNRPKTLGLQADGWEFFWKEQF